jgi:hypothetical protein
MEKSIGAYEVFNLEIDGAHQYFVTEQCILAHNAVGNAANGLEKGASRNAVKGFIGEYNGYSEALARNEIGIQAPGKAMAPGPDYITMRINPDGTGTIVVYDAKFANGPSTLSGAKLDRWMAETTNAVNAMQPGPLRDLALGALAKGRVQGQIYKYTKG